MNVVGAPLQHGAPTEQASISMAYRATMNLKCFRDAGLSVLCRKSSMPSSAWGTSSSRATPSHITFGTCGPWAAGGAA